MKPNLKKLRGPILSPRGTTTGRPAATGRRIFHPQSSSHLAGKVREEFMEAVIADLTYLYRQAAFNPLHASVDRLRGRCATQRDVRRARRDKSVPLSLRGRPWFAQPMSAEVRRHSRP